MFHDIHHRNWFPFVLGFLSLLLLLFVVWAIVSKNSSEVINEGSTITFEQYQTSARLALGDFQNRYETDTYWEARLALVSEVEQNLLALRVPAEGRAVHFELVSAMELLKQGLSGEPNKLEEGQTRLQKVLSENSWLQK
ncbi:MAG: hypothetical protein WC702_01805 [Patescibacteria group bacterium]|jgi:hypothetical protein